MEQFAIWNLLKTMLNNSPAPSVQAVKTAETQSNTAKSAAVNNGASNPTAPQDNASEQENQEPIFSPSANACEEYLLRHERLHNQRKK